MAAIIALALSVPSAAQDSTKAEWKSPLEPGVWALEFETQARLSSFSYGGGTIAGKRHFSARSALEVGVSIYFNEREENATVTRTEYVGVNAYGFTDSDVDDNYENQSYSIFTHYVKYASLWRRFGVFWAAGPIVQWDSYFSSYDFPHPDSVALNRSDDTDTWGIGLDAVAGFEWFFSDRLSLGGRFGLTGIYRTGDRTSVDQYYDPASLYGYDHYETAEIEQVLIQTNPVVLVLSGYF